jgi:hypothetical protein
MRAAAVVLALDRFGDDVRVAARLLIQARGFTAMVIITLSVALALQTSVVAVVNAYLIRALPYPGADRLYQVDALPVYSGLSVSTPSSRQL